MQDARCKILQSEGILVQLRIDGSTRPKREITQIYAFVKNQISAKGSSNMGLFWEKKGSHEYYNSQNRLNMVECIF